MNAMERGGGTDVPLTVCGIVKRALNLLKRKLPITSDDTGGQPSCGDQSETTDGLGLGTPLNETPLEAKHKIFLSHSGSQKSFVEQLCKDIERYDRYPFFDTRRTCLPIGCHFPDEIFKAIRQCKVAVVVLSEEFFSRGKWPMLELSALVKRKCQDPDLIIMPVFLGLTRGQCRDEKNNERWFSLWESWAKEDQRIIIAEWKAVFKMFGYTNSVSVSGGDEVKCREDIVDAVCKEVPPETRCDDSRVQGRLRMCKTIDEKIKGMELSKRYNARILGLYGMGGIGKTTACMTVCNHYFERFQGRVCHVQFGETDESQMLQEILRRLTDTDREQIERLNEAECKGGMKAIRKHDVFLALDNVSDSDEIVERAKLILRSGFAEGTIVIVAARSLEQLQCLYLDKSECVEMPELDVVDAISLFVQEVGIGEPTAGNLVQQCVDLCRFRTGDGANSHYHPLALRVLGGQLGSDPSRWLEKLAEIDVFNQYRENHDKHPIHSILSKSFDVLIDEDRDLFMDCALFAIGSPGFFWDRKYGIHLWLSIMHRIDLTPRLKHLKRKSLIQSIEGKNIGIHDLWREFCVMRTKTGDSRSRRWIYEELPWRGDLSNREPSLPIDIWEGVERASVVGRFSRSWNVTLNLRYCSRRMSLDLLDVNIEGGALDLSSALYLRSLRVKTGILREILGLGSLKCLRLLDLLGRFRNQKFIAEIGGLTNLQILNLHDYSWIYNEAPNVSKLLFLESLAFFGFFVGNYGICTLAMENLKHLCLRHCGSSQWCIRVGESCSLKELEISDCGELIRFPDLRGLESPKKSHIAESSWIEALLEAGYLVALLELRVRECPKLLE